MLRKGRFAQWFQRRFLLRLHMTFILGGTFLAGLAATKLMLLAGLVDNLALRYGVAVCAAYVAFLALIRLWLRYVSASTDDGSIDFSGDGLDFAAEIVDDWSPPVDGVGGGGSFGGGGSSGSWGSGAESQSMSVASNANRGCFPFEIDFDELIVVVVFLALVASLLFAGIYIIWTAPVILTEAAFEAALAGALARRARKIDRPGWVGAVTRATAWPFIAILVLAIALGWAVQRACPDASSLRDAFHCTRR